MSDLLTKLRAAALWYHSEGLCVIPIVPGDKRPAIDWEVYHAIRSTRDEIKTWWSETPYNVGVVHGAVSGNMVSIDIDHDGGIFAALNDKFPILSRGRVEQSGSYEGYHIPVRVSRFPDFGLDLKQNRPKGNKTWRTPIGAINIRAQFCQTVIPPSIHPSGNPYRFINKGPIVEIDNLDDVAAWAEGLLPKSAKSANRSPRKTNQAIYGNELLDTAIKSWTTMAIFRHFGVTGKHRSEPNGDTRVLGNGGLLINEESQAWYIFEADEGGGPIEAWAYLTFGSSEHKRRHLRAILLDMVYAAGGDVARFYRPGDENLVDISTPQIETPWSKKYSQAWSVA